ncbi:MAG: MarR family transcriptional regulator [Deltaproteobacteria bacterium]|nr:MarR family transcriptional regulator [Deltaproteobacteria bacterium]
MEDAVTFKNVNELIGVIHRYMRRFLESNMKKFEITPPQFEVLVTLWVEDGVVLSELGRRLSRDGPTITGIIDRMEKKKLLVRKRSLRDRRVIQVYLTPMAWEIKENLMKMQSEAARDIAGSFTQEDVSTLENLLRKVLCNIEEKIVPRIEQ